MSARAPATTTEAGAPRRASGSARRARVVPAGASSASAAAGVTVAETMLTAAPVAPSDGSVSLTTSSARAPARRAAMSFSSRDVFTPDRGDGAPSSASAMRSRASTPAQSS